jgi:hypothetical protein
MKEPLFHLKYTNSGANNDRSFVPPGIDDRRYGYLSPTDMAVKKRRMERPIERKRRHTLG